MAVIVLTATVAAAGVSACRTRTVRGHVVLALQYGLDVRPAVERAYRRDGAPPRNRTAAGFVRHRKSYPPYVDSLEIVDARIEIRFGADADGAIRGKALSLTPHETVDQEIVWVCGNHEPDVGLRPLGFARGGNQAARVLTTIDRRYLPPHCRWSRNSGWITPAT